jgi:hypothetical protein
LGRNLMLRHQVADQCLLQPFEREH